MVAAEYTAVRTNFDDYFHKAANGIESFVVSKENDKDIVIISLEQYDKMMKAIRNAEYLAMIDEGVAQLKAGKGQVHELIEVDDE